MKLALFSGAAALLALASTADAQVAQPPAALPMPLRFVVPVFLYRGMLSLRVPERTETLR